MNVWLVSPAWRRYPVTRLALAQRRWLCDELAARGHTADCVVVADDRNLDVARDHGFHTVTMDNTDLGQRFNAGYRYAGKRGADVLVHIGSDDWLHPDVFGVLDEINLDVAPAPDVIPPQGIVWRRTQTVVAQAKISVVDLETGKLQRCRVRGRWGCIPWLIPAAAMEASGFRPIRLGLMRGIDGALARGLKTRPNWLIREVADDSIVDFKSSTNLTPFEPLIGNLGVGDPLPLATLRASYPGELVDLAEETRLELAAVPA